MYLNTSILIGPSTTYKGTILLSHWEMTNTSWNKADTQISRASKLNWATFSKDYKFWLFELNSNLMKLEGVKQSIWRILKLVKFDYEKAKRSCLRDFQAILLRLCFLLVWPAEQHNSATTEGRLNRLNESWLS